MNVVEMKMNGYEDRNIACIALIRSGYKVWVREEKYPGRTSSSDFFVCLQRDKRERDVFMSDSSIMKTESPISDGYWIAAITVASLYECSDIKKLYSTLKDHFADLGKSVDKAEIYSRISSELPSIIETLTHEGILTDINS